MPPEGELPRVTVAGADAAMRAWAAAALPPGTAVRSVAPVTERGAHGVWLLDVRLPGALDAIRALSAVATVVAWSPADDDERLLEAIAGGATGCLTGTPDAAAVRRAIAGVAAGDGSLPRAVLARVVAGLGPGDEGSHRSKSWYFGGPEA